MVWLVLTLNGLLRTFGFRFPANSTFWALKP